MRDKVQQRPQQTDAVSGASSSCQGVCQKGEEVDNRSWSKTAGVPALSQPGFAWLNHPDAVLYSLQTSANDEVDGKLAEQSALHAH